MRHWRLPAIAKQVVGRGSNGEGPPPPVAQAEKRGYADSPKARRVSALRSFQAPIEVSLGAGGVHLGIDGAIVSLLIDHQTVGARLRNGPVFLGLHRADFEREAGHLLVQGPNAIGQITVGDKLAMLA